MEWIIFGLLLAAAYSVAQLWAKKSMQKADALIFFLIYNSVFAILSLIGMIIFWDKVSLPLALIPLYIFSGILILIEELLFLKSLKYASVGETIPLLSLTPLFTTLLAFYWLGEAPGQTGLIGISAIVLGTYILNAGDSGGNLLTPIMTIFRNRGSRYMFYVALLYGLGSVIDKYMVTHTNFESYLMLWSFFVLPFAAFYVRKHHQRIDFSKYKWELRHGAIYAAILVVVYAIHLYTLTLTYVAYVIAIKRLAILFSVVVAFFLFSERKNFVYHLAGTALMVWGVFLLVS